MTKTNAAVSRRGFVQGSTITALAALAGAGGTASLFGSTSKQAWADEEAQEAPTEVVANEIPEEGEVIWQSCCHCGFVACPP